MKQVGRRVKSWFLLPVLLFTLFCVFDLLSAGEVERIIAINKTIAAAKTPRERFRDQATVHRPLELRLGRTAFDPLGETPEQEEEITQIQQYGKEEACYYIVQFDGPVQVAWKKSLREAGADLFDYIPDFAFIIRLDPKHEDIVRSLSHVRWLGIYQPLYRIDRRCLERVRALTSQGGRTSVILRVHVFPGEDLERIKSEITALGGTVMDSVSTEWRTTLKVTVPADRVADLPSISGVRWVEPWPERKLHNDRSTDVMGVRTPRDVHGLYGEGQTVGVCDTGLDQGSADPADLHDDFEDGSGGARVTTIIDCVGDGADDVNSGHGTHVAGSVLGNGRESGSDPSVDSFPTTCFAGMAPKARLVFQAVENNTSGSLSGIPWVLTPLFTDAQGAGADLHTNSWGSDAYGQYDSDSQTADEYMWDHKDFLILFSAGNAGIDEDGNGVIDLSSVGSPATAKNCLTVGASEGDRPSFSCTYGASWGEDYPAEPISSDRLADDPEGMVAFSARGPCLDGRYKPDIVAPGTLILSTRSSVASESGWGAYNTYYMYNGGTSMATPLVAGAAALMREYLMEEKGFSPPSAALIKAALLNSAEDISPGQYGTGTVQEIPDSPVPNNVEGWGRLNLAGGVFPVPPFHILYFDEQEGVETGEYMDYSFSVWDAGYPLKVNLVWTDYPGSPASQGGLVNDLDLKVTDPAAAVHYPDGVAQGGTIAYESGSFDGWLPNGNRAVRFTPESYPAEVTAAVFSFYNYLCSASAVAIVVYDDDGTGGFPGTELFRTTLASVPSGWNMTAITGVTVASGDFYIAVEEDDANRGIYAVDDGNPTGRSCWHNGSVWTVSSFTTAIRAEVQYAASFDRANNVVGLTLVNPATGIYTIRVSGYSVPQGPQPYALVVSGGMTYDGIKMYLYYPHVASHDVWKTEICVINNSSTETVNGVFKAYNDAGVLVSEIYDVTMAPHGRREITVGDEFTSPGDIRYIIFESGSKDLVGYTKFYKEGHYRAAVPAVPDSEINTGDIYVPHIASGGTYGWGTGINLLNTTASVKELTIEFDDGQTRTVELAANEHKAFMLRSLFGGASQPGIHSAVIRGATGVIGQEIFTTDARKLMSGIGLKNTTTDRIYYPHIASGGALGWGTGVHAYNPSATDCDITITPYSQEGVQLTQVQDTISAGGPYGTLARNLGLDADTAWLMIDASTPITGFELFSRTNLLAGFTAVGITGTEGTFPKLERDGATGISFVNTEATGATVTLTAYNDSGTVVATEEITLEGYEKVTDQPRNIFTGPLTSATYVSYTSTRELAAFQTNASSDNMMLDALPGL